MDRVEQYLDKVSSILFEFLIEEQLRDVSSEGRQLDRGQSRET